jgi:NAD(P)-dependent dehydrogenase (short-subunit alcohol dehydrogenase family)
MPDKSSARTVVITGGSSGIGRATAGHFARMGWQVGLIARNEEGLRLARQDVEIEHGTGCIAVADVSDSQALEEAAASIEHELGPIDVWVNNAGVGQVSPFMDDPGGVPTDYGDHLYRHR